MKVYLPNRRNHTLFVAPGVFHEVSDWREDDGTPKQIQVKFTDGEASVPKNLGEWMISQKLAQRTRLILPELLRA